MSEYINLIRPDGSVLQSSKENAAELISLGYKEESMEQNAERMAQETKKEYFTTGGQGIKAFAEGALSGATFGISDVIAKEADWDVSERAAYNPGKRFAGELTGAIAGSLIPGAPVNLLARGAASLTKGIGSAAVRGAVTGAIEGAAFGAGSQIAHATLTGDPLTVESTLAGAGWGAVWGAGIGGAFGGISGKLEARAANRAAEKAALEKAATPIAPEAYAAFRNSIDDAGSAISKTFKETDAALKAIDEGGEATIKSARDSVSQARQIREGFFNEMEVSGMESYPGMLQQKKAGIAAYKDMKEALKHKDWEKLATAQEKFQNSLDEITGLSKKHNANVPEGMPTMPDAPPITPFTPAMQLQNKSAESALKELTKLGAASRALKSLPTDAAGFASMTSAKADRLIASVDAVMSSSAAELEGIRKALGESIANTSANMGIAVEGNVTTQLRGIWEQASKASKTAAKEIAEKMTEGSKGLSWARGIGNVAMSPVRGLMFMKGAVTGAIVGAAEKWVPGAVKATAWSAGKIQPLKVRLDGTEDKDRVDKIELMNRRAKEIRDAAPSIKDTLYRAVSPLQPEHPEFAKATYETALKQFSFLLNKLPKDPGQAYSRLQTLYKPDPVAAEKFSRYYAVFQNPVAVINEALRTMNITPETAEGVREMWPALFTELRVNMMARISDPKVRDKMSYDEQVRIGMLLDIPFHSTMTPQFIANQMAMYAERQKPLNMPAQPGMQESGGRPSPTQSQQNQGH